MTSLYWCHQHGEWTPEATIIKKNSDGEDVHMCPVCLLPCAEISIYGERGLTTYVCTKDGCKWFGWDPNPNITTTDGKATGWTLTCPYCGSLVKTESEDS